MKYFVIIVCAFAFLSCKNDPVVTSDSEPEFILNRIACSFRVYTMIDSASSDTTIKTVMNYGLNAYFRKNYGLVSHQIVSFNGYIDTLYGSAVTSKPDIINPPVGSIQYEVPNILDDLDSVKVVAQIFGSFYSDGTLQTKIGDFYRADSNYAHISRLIFVRRLTSRSS